jgi:uncharacterized protein YciI
VSEAFVRPNQPLCLVILTYTAPLDEVDALMQPHVDWLSRAFAEGVLLVAGRRMPRTGGVLLFRGEEAAVAKVAATDPFVAGGVATAEVVAFNASMAAPGLEPLLA